MNAQTHAHPRSLWLVTLSAVACVAYAGLALGGPSDDVQSITVGFADLNVSTPSGAASLYGRIQKAASLVCGAQPSNVELARAQDWQACYRSAVSNAVASANKPTLTALHDRKTGRKTPQLAKR